MPVKNRRVYAYTLMQILKKILTLILIFVFFKYIYLTDPCINLYISYLFNTELYILRSQSHSIIYKNIKISFNINKLNTLS